MSCGLSLSGLVWQRAMLKYRKADAIGYGALVSRGDSPVVHIFYGNRMQNVSHSLERQLCNIF